VEGAFFRNVRKCYSTEHRNEVAYINVDVSFLSIVGRGSLAAELEEISVSAVLCSVEADAASGMSLPGFGLTAHF
jgi:hypothetical protein